MLPAERRKQILELVEERHALSVTELCTRLEVSEMTIRRDLRALADEGLLQRVHGGVIARRSRSYEPPHMQRASANVEAKRAIAGVAVSLVTEGDSLAIDVGTTTLEIARSLVGVRNLTVLTASLPIANSLVDAPDIRLILTGGIVRKQELSMVGHVAEHTLLGFHADKAFIGIGGLHLETGLTEYNLEDALVKRALIACAEQVIVVADSSKLQRTCFVSVAGLGVVHTLITDSGAPPQLLAELSRKGVNVLVAGVTEPQARAGA